MQYIYATNKNRRSGTAMQKCMSRGSGGRWHRSREVMHGFPIARKFSSAEEAEAYVSGAEVTCLLCGKPYKSLGVHILKVHGVNTDHYREMYDIPTRIGLEGAERKKQRQTGCIFAKEPKKYAQTLVMRQEVVLEKMLRAGCYPAGLFYRSPFPLARIVSFAPPQQFRLYN